MTYKSYVYSYFKVLNPGPNCELVHMKTFKTFPVAHGSVRFEYVDRGDIFISSPPGEDGFKWDVRVGNTMVGVIVRHEVFDRIVDME